MEIKKIVIAGINELSTQIAWQAAVRGLEVTLYDPFDSNYEKWATAKEEFADHFELNLGLSPVQIYIAQTRIRFMTDLSEALKGADLVHECYPDNLHLKKVFYKELPRFIGPYTIISTNGTVISSLLLAYILELDRFTGMQMNVPIWLSNLVEVAPLPQTRKSVLEKVNRFVQELGLIPMHVDCAQLENTSTQALVPN